MSVRLWSALPIFANDTTQNNKEILEMMDQNKKKSMLPMSEYDHYRNIIEIRKECEKITCAPYPKDPNQSPQI